MALRQKRAAQLQAQAQAEGREQEFSENPLGISGRPSAIEVRAAD
jgi:hypothetical protein